jgi:hypothetical protein
MDDDFPDDFPFEEEPQFDDDIPPELLEPAGKGIIHCWRQTCQNYESKKERKQKSLIYFSQNR